MLIQLRNIAAVIGAAAGVTGAQSLSGNAMALRSSGNASGSSWVLSENGYVGTYITLAAPGTVNFNVQATAQSGTGAVPRLGLVVGDSRAQWNVGATGSFAHSIALPAGTHFVRAQVDNIRSGAGQSLAIQNLSISGAAFANSSTSANALAAADTYIANYRRGNAVVALSGPGNIPLLPGTPIHVDLKRNAFNFGTAVAGFNGSSYLQSNPAPGTTAYNYQQALNADFNSVVPENAGKWASNSSGSSPPPPGTAGNISYLNQVLSYAHARNMRVRGHNLIWGSQQPTWVNNMLANSGSWSTLRQTYISDRIRYYVGDALDGNPNDDPANRMIELDVYNETFHTGSQNNTSYWRSYGAGGVAGIYNDVATAAASVGANLKLFVNEYNVVQDSSDSYANWYRRHVETLLQAGAQIDGIGVQSYPNPTGIGPGNDQHNAARMYAALQNLSVLGKDVVLSEFGAKAGTGELASAQILDEQMRLVYGTPDATGFMMWGFWQGDIYRGDAAFYTSTWQPRMPLNTWRALMSAWDTDLSSAVNADGAITFTGTFGDYNLGAQAGFANLTLQKGVGAYEVSLAAPPMWSNWQGGAVGSWHDSASWSAGVPNAPGQTAYFGDAAGPRIVTSAGPSTVGMLAFDSAQPVTLAGAAITLDGLAGVSVVYVARGSHTIDTPLVLLDDLRAVVRHADDSLDVVSPLLAGGRAVQKHGDGTLRVQRIDASSVDISGGVLQVRPSATANHAGGVSVMEHLAVTNEARLDLSNNAAVVDYTGASPLDAICALLESGYDDGSWMGAGIASSSAGATSGDSVRTSLGIAEASRVFASFPAIFAGQVVDDTSLLLMYTTAGDANLDGGTDIADFAILGANFNGPARWSAGDFNFDAMVTISDFAILAGNFNARVGSAARPSAVPEPSGAALACALLWQIGRRQRRVLS